MVTVLECLGDCFCLTLKCLAAVSLFTLQYGPLMCLLMRFPEGAQIKQKRKTLLSSDAFCIFICCEKCQQQHFSAGMSETDITHTFYSCVVCCQSFKSKSII